MKINSKDFRIPPGKGVDLGKWPTIVDPYYKSKKQYKELLLEHMEKLSSLQQLHYASNQFALLLIFQGMDGAGKDGAIRHVMSGVNPEGCEVYSFKQPSTEELQHDFLWRSTCRLPERGRIGIFNRSYYEEVLIVRVHPEILRNEGLSKEFRDEKNIWKGRYRSINDLEGHLYRNSTRTIKIFLHLSHDEQRKRLIALQDGPVILVGHSYAGVVITEAGNDPKVVGLVYVAAFAPREGESINSVSKPYPPAPLGSELRPDAQGFLTATPKGIAEDMAQDLSVSDQQVLTATQGQTAAAVFGATVTRAAWKPVSAIGRWCWQFVQPALWYWSIPSSNGPVLLLLVS